MISKETLAELKKDNAVTRKKTPVELGVESISEKINQVNEHNKYIEDTLNKLKLQIEKGKQFRFTIGRDESGLIKDITAVPLE